MRERITSRNEDALEGVRYVCVSNVMGERGLKPYCASNGEHPSAAWVEVLNANSVDTRCSSQVSYRELR